MTLTAATGLGHTKSPTPSARAEWARCIARDPKLNRDVAVKVLPAAFAQDHERVVRFKREAQVLASVNHPNLAAVYGLEEVDGAVALVMELVEGEDLSAMSGRRPAPRSPHGLGLLQQPRQFWSPDRGP